MTGFRLARGVLLAGLLLAQLGCDSGDGRMPDGDEVVQFTIEIANISRAYPILKSGAIERPAGSARPIPAEPDERFELRFAAPPFTVPGEEMRLSLALMFVESNDAFYSFGPGGISLYHADGTPRGLGGAEDVTSEVFLYDAGTELNEEPGIGLPNQPGGPDDDDANVGPSEGGVVQMIPDGGMDAAGFTYPDKLEVLRVDLIYEEAAQEFLLRVRNVSRAQPGQGICTLMPSTGGCKFVRLSPLVWAVHNASHPFFEVGQAAPEYLERLAEDGNPLPWAEALEDDTGVTAPVSPGAYALHANEFSFYTIGNAVSEGIEWLAEDGDPTALEASFGANANVKASGVFARPVGANADGPIGPGESYAFTVEAVRGDRLSLALMFVQSNDLFYAFETEGLSLFSRDDPLSGDVTVRLRFFDAGTEGDEEPGVGAFQPIRQAELNTGPEGEGTLIRIGSRDDGFTYPDIASLLRVTLTPDTVATME